MSRREEPSDLDCIRAAVRAYRLVERVRPRVPERIRRALSRLTPTERRAAERGIALVEEALCRALTRSDSRQPAAQ